MELIHFVCGFVLLATITPGLADTTNRSFTIDYEQNTFLKDGKPFRYISGSFHYYRAVEEYWESILKKMHLAGLDAVQTYVEWSRHQRTPEEIYDFSGNLDLFRFLNLAQKKGLLVILRPGPFIDAERDMGGLPPWLLWQKDNMSLRTSDLEFVYFVSRWFDYLLPRLKPYLYHNGGPIIMVQVENEYGSYGCDKNYTTFLRDLFRLHLGDDVVLFTTDGSGVGYLKCGAIPNVYPTVDFGTASESSVKSFFKVQRSFAPKGPLVNSEFYPGWLDHWGSPHSTVKSEAVTSTLYNMLSMGANVNFYMFYGGTSFGFSAGSNADSKSFSPCPTSYDYDAPLDEAGDPTEKYFAIKDMIQRFKYVPKQNPEPLPKGALGKIVITKATDLFNPELQIMFSGRKIENSVPLSFEELKTGTGFILYQTDVDVLVPDPALLVANDLRDRAYVYVNEELVGILSRAEGVKSMPLMIRRGAKLSIVVENQGRPCYGSLIGESKGLGSTVTLGGHLLTNWTMWKLGELEGKVLTKFAASILQSNDTSSVKSFGGGPGVYYGNFTISNGSIWDTFVRLDSWAKGFVWVNGFNLGRYWPVVGPQETLYLPAPILRKGKNSIAVLELERAPAGCDGMSRDNKNCFVVFTSQHVINATTPLQAPVPQWGSRLPHERLENPVPLEPPTYWHQPSINLTIKGESGVTYGNSRGQGRSKRI